MASYPLLIGASILLRCLSFKYYASFPSSLLHSKYFSNKNAESLFPAAPRLMVSENIDEQSKDINLQAWLSPDTRGGVIFWGTTLITVPILIYNYFVGTGIEETIVGAYVGASAVLISMVGWASTYLFRVVNKDMTYARQLKDYENAVLQKRLDELADDEIVALLEEIDVESSNEGKL